MMGSLRFNIIILVLLLAWTPSHAQKKSKAPPGFVYGNIHGIEGIRHVYIQKLGKVYIGNFNRPKTEVLEGGTYYFDKVEPGEYYLAGFSIRGGDLFWIPYTKESVQEALFTVNESVVKYMGSYEVSNVSQGGFKKGSFEIDPSKTPTEKKILQTILKSMKDNEWKQMLNERLKKL